MPIDEDHPGQQGDLADRATRLDYIAELLAEIRKMALSMEEELLAHIVEVAMLEAKLKSGLHRKFEKLE